MSKPVNEHTSLGMDSRKRLSSTHPDSAKSSTNFLFSRTTPRGTDTGKRRGYTGRQKKRGSTGLVGNLVLFSVSTILAVGIMEAFLASMPQLQVQANEGEYVFCSPPYTRHVEHPDYGYTETPGANLFERNSRRDPWYYVRVNNEGFRDNHRHEGERIIVLGDSMTRGSLVNEYETFSSLMNQWHPDMAFQTFAAGGYGQANTLQIYRGKSSELPHKLAIQQITLPNDIDDNAERSRKHGNDGIEVDFEKVTAKTTESTILLLSSHQLFWRNSNFYRIVYNFAIRSHVENWDARRDIDNALELTRRLLVSLAEEAHANGVDLLLLVIPGWPEIVGRDDGMEPELQRDMFREFVAQTPNTHLLDVTPHLAGEDPDRTYGVIDKHLTAYGHFVVAVALDDWVRQFLFGEAEGSKPDRIFVEQPPITPDCTLVEEYLDRVRSI